MNRVQQLRKQALVACTIALLLLLAAPAHSATMLRWTGCGITKKAFMAEAAKAYQAKTGVLISISGGGATKGIRAANSGAADMGGTCRPSLPARFAAEEGKVKLTVVAWDGLVPIVSKENPINDISSADLKRVMKGEVKNWQEIGGPDKKLLVVARVGKVSGVGYMTRKLIFEDPDLDYAPDALRLKSSGPVENKVRWDATAIGITGVSSAGKRISKGEPLKILTVDGQEASVANISSGAYPFFRPLFLATQGAPTGETKKFMDWLVSPEGQAVVEAQNTVSLQQGKGLKAKFQDWENTENILNFDQL